MSEILVNTIKKADGTGSITVPAETGTIITSASVPTGNTPNWLAARTTDQSIPNATATVIAYDTATFDTDSGLNTSTGRYTVQTGKAGKYYIAGGFRHSSSAAMTRVVAYVYKNGSPATEFNNPQSTNGEASAFVSTIIELSEGDIVDIRIFHNAGSTQNIQSTNGKTLFMGFRLSE